MLGTKHFYQGTLKDIIEHHKGYVSKLFELTKEIRQIKGYSRLQRKEVKEPHKFIYLHLSGCKQCETLTGLHNCDISYSQEPYYQVCKETRHWMESDFVTSFGFLALHANHNPRVSVRYPGFYGTDSGYTANPNSEVVRQAQVKPVPKGVTEVISLVKNSVHYATVSVRLDEKLVVVYDGSKYPLSTWLVQNINLLLRLGVVPLHPMSEESKQMSPVQRMQLRPTEADYGPFTVSTTSSLYKQTDGLTCGIIACAAALNRITDGVFEPSSTYPEPKNLRGYIVDMYKLWVLKFSDVLQVKKSSNQAGLIYEPEYAEEVEETGPVKKLSVQEDDSAIALDKTPPRKRLHTTPSSKLTSKRTLPLSDHRKEASAIANKRQKAQGEAMEARHNQIQTGVMLGTPALIHIDWTEKARCSVLKVMAVAFDASPSGTSFCFVTPHGGILSSNSSNKKLYLSQDKFTLYKTPPTLEPALGEIQRAIPQGVFHEDDYPKVSVKKAQELMLGHKSQGKRACGCKSNQPCSSGKCLCFKNNRTCHSGCKCGSSCCNPNK
jgi:hypothetical protein